MGRRGRRALATPVAALLVTAASSGCTPKETAEVGFGVDAAGRPVASVRVCDGAVDELTLYSGDLMLARWTPGEDVRSTATVPLAEPPADWAVVHPLPPLEPGVKYWLSASSDANRLSWVVNGSGWFTTETLAGLSPGTVTYVTGWDADDSRDITSTVTPSEFADTACLKG